MSNLIKYSSRYGASLTAAKITFGLTAVCLSIFYYHKAAIVTNDDVITKTDNTNSFSSVKKINDRIAGVQNFKSPPFPPPLGFGKNLGDGVSPPSSAPPAFISEYYDEEKVDTVATADQVITENDEENLKLLDHPKMVMSESDEGGGTKNEKFSYAIVEGPPPFNTAIDAHTQKISKKTIDLKQEITVILQPKATVFSEFEDTVKPEIYAARNTGDSEKISTTTKRRRAVEDSDWLNYSKTVILGDGHWSVWFWTFWCALAVMSTGIVPALIFISDRTKNEVESGANSHGNSSLSEINLNRLLCFAVGNLLGDVFFHLLPESWGSSECKVNVGLYVIAGLLTCLVIEKFCARSEESQHYVAAMANLTANIMDNFTHGLAVGGSFLVSKRLGFVTTFAILLHEIPHEISDFAILLRANFNRWSAIKAQLITATGGILGAFVALASASEINGSSTSASSANSIIQQRAAWILPFTAGGFLNIALVQILPDILKEEKRGESLKHVLMICFGIAVMAFLNSSMAFV